MSEVELPEGWLWATLPDLIATDGVMTDGDWVESVDQDPNGEVRLTQLADVGDGVFRDRSDRYMTRAKADELRCTYLQKGDVLVARMPDPLGRACLFPGSKRPCVTVVDVCIVRPGSSGVHTPWLMHFINSPRFRVAISELQAGSTRKRISKANLSTIKLPVPPLPEQLSIAAAIESYFSRLDAATATLERVQRNLERYRASVLKAAVEGRLVPTEAALAKREGRSFEPATTLLQRILKERRRRWETAELAKLTAKGKPPTDDRWKAKYEEPAAPDTSNLPELPAGWCWTTLDAIADVRGGLAKGKQRSTADRLRLVPYLRVANVQRGHLDLAEIKSIEATENEIAELALRTGDVLFNEGGDRDKLGRGWIWQGQVPLCIHQNHVFRARIHGDGLIPELLSWHGNSNGQAYFFDEGKHTTNLASISLSKLRGLPVPLAPHAEQERIKVEVDRLLSLCSGSDAATANSLQRVTRLRQSILKWAFEGRLAEAANLQLKSDIDSA